MTCSIKQDHEVLATPREEFSCSRDSTDIVPQVSMPAHRSAVRCVSVSQDDRLLATSSKGLVRAGWLSLCVAVWLTICRHGVCVPVCLCVWVLEPICQSGCFASH